MRGGANPHIVSLRLWAVISSYLSSRVTKRFLRKIEVLKFHFSIVYNKVGGVVGVVFQEYWCCYVYMSPPHIATFLCVSQVHDCD